MAKKKIALRACRSLILFNFKFDMRVRKLILFLSTRSAEDHEHTEKNEECAAVDDSQSVAEYDDHDRD
jgi:hypothetical protein